MSREIKFRGLTKEGKWVYGHYCQLEGQHFIIHEDAIHTWSGDSCCIMGVHEVIPETVGQFTDEIMDSREVFAGDILEYWFGAPWNPEQPIRVTGKVIWQNSGWWFHCPGEYPGHLADVGEGKVIGNVHQNPELIKSG